MGDGGGNERGIDMRRAGAVAGLAAAVIVAACAPAAAQAGCAAATGEPVWAARVVSGDEIVTVDGRRLVLAGVEAPRPPPTAAGPVAKEAVAAAEAARVALADRVEGREIAFGDIGTDRHGRRVGHLYDTEAGQWIVAALVAAGHLRVVPRRAAPGCVEALLSAERSAIAAGRGVWATAAFAVASTSPADLLPRVGRWSVVEGRVRSIGRSGGHIWLNFGEDFRRDFAVVMKDKDLDGLRAAGFDATTARGRMVRVRGVIVHRGGPRIAVEVPGEIEGVGR